MEKLSYRRREFKNFKEYEVTDKDKRFVNIEVEEDFSKKFNEIVKEKINILYSKEYLYWILKNIY